MYQGDKRYYRFQSAQRYVDYAELIHELPETSTLFTNNPKKDALALPIAQPTLQRLFIKQVQDEAAVLDHLRTQSQHRTFILCGQKNRARSLWESIQAA